MSVGPVKAQPMGGHRALDYTDLYHYAAMTKSLSEPWEARTVVAMSEAYLRGLHEGESPFSIIPQDRDEYRAP